MRLCLARSTYDMGLARSRKGSERAVEAQLRPCLTGVDEDKLATAGKKVEVASGISLRGGLFLFFLDTRADGSRPNRCRRWVSHPRTILFVGQESEVQNDSFYGTEGIKLYDHAYTHPTFHENI